MIDTTHLHYTTIKDLSATQAGHITGTMLDNYLYFEQQAGAPVGDAYPAFHHVTAQLEPVNACTTTAHNACFLAEAKALNEAVNTAAQALTNLLETVHKTHDTHASVTTSLNALRAVQADHAVLQSVLNSIRDIPPVVRQVLSHSLDNLDHLINTVRQTPDIILGSDQTDAAISRQLQAMLLPDEPFTEDSATTLATALSDAAKPVIPAITHPGLPTFVLDTVENNNKALLSQLAGHCTGGTHPIHGSDLLAAFL